MVADRRAPPAPPASGGAKSTRFEVISRDADWVQVESGRVSGWISGRFLAPGEPR